MIGFAASYMLPTWLFAGYDDSDEGAPSSEQDDRQCCHLAKPTTKKMVLEMELDADEEDVRCLSDTESSDDTASTDTETDDSSVGSSDDEDQSLLRTKTTASLQAPSFDTSPKQKQTKKKKSVRFDLSSNEEYAASPRRHFITKSQLKDRCWYRHVDYSLFGTQTQQLASKVKEAQQVTAKQCLTTVLQAFEQCECVGNNNPAPDAACTNSTMCQAFLTSHQMKMMTKFQQEPSRVGLERWAVPGLSKFILRNRMDHQFAVLELQSEFRKQRILQSRQRSKSSFFSAVLPPRLVSGNANRWDDSFVDVDDSEPLVASDDFVTTKADEVIRCEAERISLASRLFARALGEAIAASTEAA